MQSLTLISIQSFLSRKLLPSWIAYQNTCHFFTGDFAEAITAFLIQLTLQNHDQNVPTGMNVKSKIASFLHARVYNRKRILPHDLNTKASEFGKGTAAKINNVDFAEESGMSEIYESHRVLLV